MKTRGNYIIEEENYDLNVMYKYYWSDGNYDLPPEDELEIITVDLNGVDITDFFWDWVTDGLKEIVWKYAQENKFN